MSFDTETISLLRSIRDGAIRDPDRVRFILAESREELNAYDQRLGEGRLMLHKAEQAFLRGWSETSNCPN